MNDVTTTMKNSIVWDNHGCIPLRPLDEEFLPQLSRYRDSGVDVVMLNVGFDSTSVENNFRVIASFRRWLQQRPDQYQLIETVSDIDRARRNGRLAIGFDLEGFKAVGEQISLVSLYYELGVRWMLIAYNRNNAGGGGCQDEDCGLTDFGRSVLDEMERVGMVACCSHTGYQTAREVIDYSNNPVILSHSNPLALVNHPRNVPDDVMRACADSGGVMGITGVGIFLGDHSVSTTTIVEHIDYAAGVMGVEHVGLGLDYCFDQAEVDEYVASLPEVFPPEKGYSAGLEFAAPEKVPEIAAGLLDRGYGQDDVSKILGGNFLRVARDVWAS